MGLTIYKRRHTTKPPASLGLDLATSLANRLEGFIPFNEYAGKPRMMPHWLLGTPSGPTKPVWSTAQGEHSMKWTTGADATPTDTYLDYGTPTNIFANLAKNPMTLMCRMWFTGAGGGGLAERNDANANNIGWEWAITSGSGNLSFLAEFSSANLSAVYNGTFRVQANRWNTLGVTYNGPNTTGSTAVTFYINGGQFAPAVASNGSGTQGADTARNLFIGRNTFISQQVATKGILPGYMAWFAGWSRILSYAEIQAVTQYPFILYESVKRPLFRLGTVPPIARPRARAFIVT